MSHNIAEKDVTKAIISTFLKELQDYVECDCIICGGGPSGLMCARELARKKVKVLLIEKNNYLGGGFWIGGYLMNKVVIEERAKKILEELKIPFKRYKDGIYVADSVHACSALIREACDAGARILNMTFIEDLVLKDKKVKGVVINRTPINYLPRALAALDPVSLEAKVVVDATGHDASLCSRLKERGLLELKGMGAMWIEESEKQVVEYTKEVFPNLFVCGMATSAVFGLPRMGPVFSSMLLSGRKVAGQILKKL